MPYEALAVNVLIFGLYAVGFNLLFGYTGLLSFGHATFFGGGAYGAGLSLAFLGVDWLSAIALGTLLAGLLALVTGALSVRLRGIYFAMVTLALSQLVYYVFLQANGITGGENGLRGITVERIGLAGLELDFLDPTTKYYVIVVFVAAALWLFSRILASPFGAVLEAIRENESRARACGYDTTRSKLVAFVLSGLFSGLAGALYALHIAIVPIDLLHYQTSGLVVMMALLGGMGTFFGPFVGAAAFLLIEDIASLWTPYWQAIAGGTFIVFVLFLRRGIWGSIVERLGR